MIVITATSIENGTLYNEAEVRFHIIDPIMRQLGYPDSENVYLNLEEKLEYPYLHIGRRSKKDVPLGFPDYRAGLKGARGSFIVEAKAGSVPITALEVEQAHSYAAHAQVGANYFVLCNGSEICIYETLSGSEATAIARVPLREVNDRFYELENILSPQSLARHCATQYDTKLKLCDGLGSSVRITSGVYNIYEHAYRILLNNQDCTEGVRAAVPQIAVLDQQLELMKTAFELRVAEGVAERDDDGRINAGVRFVGVTVHNTLAMQIMGIDKASFVTSEKFLSRDHSNPTMFESVTDFAVSKGAMMPQLFGGVAEMDGDISGEMFIKAAMHFDGSAILGQYLAMADYHLELPDGGRMIFELDLSGRCELQVAS